MTAALTKTFAPLIWDKKLRIGGLTLAFFVAMC